MKIYRSIIRSYAVPFMVAILLLSSIGVNAYERNCACTGKVYSSVLFQQQSTCCKPQAKKKACCQKSKKVCNHKVVTSCKLPSSKKKCCGNTKVRFLELDVEATLVVSLDILESIYSVSTIKYSPDLGSLVRYDFQQHLDSGIPRLNRFFPPPLLQGKERLPLLQIMRC